MNGRCKGSEAGLSLVCLGKSKEARVSGVEGVTGLSAAEADFGGVHS